MKFKVLMDDQEKELEVIRQGQRLRITYDGGTVEAHLIHTDGAHFVLEVEQPGPDGSVQRKRIRAAGHVNGDSRQLWVNGSNLAYERLRDGSAHHPVDDTHSLTAAIPAVVSEVLVAVGDHVSAGEKLILLESMKMVLPIKAPHSGTIVAVNCAAGDAVQPGVPLIELDGE